MKLFGSDLSLAREQKKKKNPKENVLGKIQKNCKIHELFGFNSVNWIIRRSVWHHQKNELFRFNSQIIRKSCDYVITSYNLQVTTTILLHR